MLTSRINDRATRQANLLIPINLISDQALRLSEGSVIELDRLAGDPLDVLVNGTLIAKGEVVMVGERFGIRFGQIIDPEKRAESL